MKQIFLIIAIFACSAYCDPTCGDVFFAFVGSNHTDFKKMNLTTEFTDISGTKYFNASKKTVLLIHGFQRGFTVPLAKTIIEAFKTKSEYNVIIGDWSTCARTLAYPKAVELIIEIAKNFMKLLYKINGYDIRDIHIIGHSLGAHISGCLGKELKKEGILMRRITGLDPAGPLFKCDSTSNSFGKNVNISGNMIKKGNAEFVDILHTDAGTFGTKYATGDQDFWINGGFAQPRCVNCGSGMFWFINCTVCDHIFVWVYFADTVENTTDAFSAIGCPSGVKSYTNETCQGTDRAIMGLYASSSAKPGNYFISIADVSAEEFNDIVTKEMADTVLEPLYYIWKEYPMLEPVLKPILTPIASAFQSFFSFKWLRNVNMEM